MLCAFNLHSAVLYVNYFSIKLEVGDPGESRVIYEESFNLT